MADTDILVSELPSASQVNTTDLVMLTQVDSGSETGYSTKKGTNLDVFNKALKGTTYSTDLPSFTTKNVLGGMEELKGDIFNLLPVDEASGSIANFETELATPLQSVLVNVLATGGNGTPDNPVAINGYTEANITRCGVNLWDEEWEVITAGGFSRIASKNYCSCLPNTRYYLCGPSISPQLFANGFKWYDENKTLISTYYYNNQAVKSPANARYFKFELGSAYGTTYNNDISINSPATDTQYHAYTGNTYTIAFGQTVYGGVLDVMRGKLTVETVKLTLNGTEAWGNYPAYNGVSLVIDNMKSGNFMNGICSHFATLSAHGHGIRFGANNNLIYCEEVYTDISGVTDVDSWKTWLSNNNIDIVYPLATPFDIDLTPVQISALVGTNNVFADTNGDTTVQYKDSIQHYIDKKIAQTQALIL